MNNAISYFNIYIYITDAENKEMYFVKNIARSS